MSAVAILVLFVGLPTAEILTFIEVGGKIGGWLTVAIIIATAFIGVALFCVQGTNALLAAKNYLRQGSMPLEELVSGLGLLFAGFFLLVPGFITDLFGLVLFIPRIRIIVLTLLIRDLVMRGRGRSSLDRKEHQEPHRGQRVIDGEYEDLTQNVRSSQPESTSADRGLSSKRSGCRK